MVGRKLRGMNEERDEATLAIKACTEMSRENAEENCRWEKGSGGPEGNMRLLGGKSKGELGVS